MVDIFYSRVCCNTYVLFNNKKEGVLIDPGYNKNNCLIDHLTKIDVKIKAILITHGHFDHIAALKEVLEQYPDAKVYIHEDEEEFLTNPKLNLSIEVPEYIDKNLDYCPSNLITLTDNEEINECGYIIKTIHTPFHTKGSCCYYIESEKACFTGDTLFYITIGRTDLPTGSNKTINSSLLKLKKLPDGIKAYPGHGVVTNLDREKKYNQYLRNI